MKVEKGPAPKKSKAYILMCEAGQPGNKAVSVKDFIDEYILKDNDIANYIFEKFALKNAGVAEKSFVALEQFVNNQYREFYDLSFNEKNLPMIWCRTKLYLGPGSPQCKQCIVPTIVMMSPYIDAVKIKDESNSVYRSPITMIFKEKTWYINYLDFLNVGPIAKARIPAINADTDDGYLAIAEKLYEYAEVR